MKAGGGLVVTVGGFSVPAVRALDVTDPSKPQKLAVSVTASGDGFSATFTTPSSRTARDILAITEGQILSPFGISANGGSTLASTTNQADLVIIAHESMLSAAAPLAALRETEGLLVKTVDVAAVYDTFGYGEKDPQAIKDFLWYASAKWAKAPGYVMLLGGASLDPRNYLGLGDQDLVPTKLVPTALLLTASDDWLVDFDGDGLPNMAIGRVPARTAQEAGAVISKIVSYGQATGAWTRNVLMVTGTGDSQNDFEGAAASVAALVPPGFTAQRVSAGQIGAAAAATATIDAINAGQLIVNYQGHGFQQAWNSPAILSVGSVPSLANAAQLPFVVSMSCLTGAFHDPTKVSLAAALLNAPGSGAVAYWGSSGLPSLSGETAVDQELFRILLGGTRPALGDAVARAKAATTDLDVRKTWIFFGDPSMKLAQ